MGIGSRDVKRFAYELGVGLCGIASVDRFGEAPKGFHPCDVLPECRSVVVLASPFLKSTMRAASTGPYTLVRSEMSRRMDRQSLELADRLEAEGVLALPVGAIGPCDWDLETNRYRGLISLKHAAVQAGLGTIGKNTLLVNDKYGNMVWLSAILVSAELEADPVAAYEGCRPDCRLCVESCPVGALDGESVNQMGCWTRAYAKDDAGELRIKCFECRKVCPNGLGVAR